MLLFNTIIILTLLHSLIYLLFFKKNNNTILSCGLFAYIGNPQNHNFNWDKFNHLGLDNDERGGDSIGRAVGEEVVKFVNNKKAKTTYQDYVINHKNSAVSHIAIGHTRKASVGIISEAMAQPVVLDLPDGQGRFIMVHNGTLFNHEALATKYGVDKAGKTDSMILAEIIMNHGAAAVLTEYEGAAAIIYRDDRFPNSLFVFKGESKLGTGKLSEERPLYYFQESEESLYISSKPDGLYFIGGDTDNVFDFDTNTLYEIHCGVIISETEIDRTNSSQTRVLVNDTYKDSYWNQTEHRWMKKTNPHISTRAYVDAEFDFNEAELINDNAITPKVYNESITRYQTSYQITFARMRYWFWEEQEAYKGRVPVLAHGCVKLDEFGYRFYIESKADKYRNFYFYYGIMMRNKSAWKTVLKMFEHKKTFTDTWDTLKIICKYSMFPICSIGKSITTENTTEWDEVRKSAQFATGTWKPYFSQFEYTFLRGDLTKRRYLTAKTKPFFADFAYTKEEEDDDVEPVVVVNGKEVKSDPTATNSMLPAANISNTPVDSTTRVIQLYEENTMKSSDEVNDLPFKEETEADYAVELANQRTDGPTDNDPEPLDAIIQKEIDSQLSTILIAFDDCKRILEQIGTDNQRLCNVVENLTKMEDLLYNNHKILQTKEITICYEEF